jgi:hypothetical protein
VNVEEAEAYLRQMLIDAGFDPTHPNPALAWEVFQRFAGVPVESGGGRECEELWFEAGDGDPVKGWPGYFDFVRFFRQYTEDGAVWNEMITAHFSCEPGVQLGLRGTVSAADLADLPAFFRAVEASPSFRAGLADSGWSFEVRLDAC